MTLGMLPITRHDDGQYAFDKGYLPRWRVRYRNSLFIDSRVGDFVLEVVVDRIMDVFAVSFSVPRPAGVIVRGTVRIDMEGILVLGELLGKVTGITPQGEV